MWRTDIAKHASTLQSARLVLRHSKRGIQDNRVPACPRQEPKMPEQDGAYFGEASHGRGLQSLHLGDASDQLNSQRMSITGLW